MKYTLLELVQTVLSSMDSDEVSSITDTVESQQVVNIIKTVYDDMVSRGDLGINKVLFNLDASADIAKPVVMYKPMTIDSIDWVKYNKVQDGQTDPAWAEIHFLPVDDFVYQVQQWLPSDPFVDTMTLTADSFTFTLPHRNDVGPTYYTTFDDNTMVFDSYDNQVDNTLQTSKTLCFGSKTRTFTESNTFTPDLQPHQFALLLNEAKSLAWAELKQSAHNKAEATARRNWRHLAKSRTHIPRPGIITKRNALDFDALPNFGRN